jgi:outer membrane biosynthesis protein TonB
MRNIGIGLLGAIPYHAGSYAHGIALLIAIGLSGCQVPEYEAEMQMIVEPNQTQTPTSTTKPAVQPTSQASPRPTSKPAVTPEQRVYVPVYQNPIVQKKLTASPTQPEAQTKRETKPPASRPQQPKQPENQTPVTNGSTIPQLDNCKDLKANPWASRLDRDKDGVACESTNR